MSYFRMRTDIQLHSYIVSLFIYLDFNHENRLKSPDICPYPRFTQYQYLFIFIYTYDLFTAIQF